MKRAPDQTYFYARWGPPDDYPIGTRLHWPDGGPLLAPDPALIDGGWPGLPLAIWRVDRVRIAGIGTAGLVRGGAFTVAERLPSWRWLGGRGDELLALIDRSVEAARVTGSDGGVADGPVHVAFPSGRPPSSTLDPRDHALAHFEWLLRQRLLDEARARDPDAVAVWEDFGCAGPFSEEFLTGRLARAEVDAVEAARALVSLADDRRSAPSSRAVAP